MAALNGIPPKPPLVFTGLPPLPAIYKLQDTAQWVNWRYVWKPNPARPEGGKWDKPPIDPRTNALASSTSQKTWGSYEEAAKAARLYPETGVGFSLSPTDGFTGIDLDKCRDPDTGALDPWAQEIIGLAETYAEVSPSGCGVRLFALGKVDKALKFDPAHVEVYGSGRYLTVTGRHLGGTPEDIKPAPRTLAALEARVAAMKPKPAEAPSYTPQVNGIVARALAGVATGSSQRGGDFFRNVNTAALNSLSSWFPAIFPTARYQAGTNGFRVTARALGTTLEEDLSATPLGIVDFGIHDMGDSREGKRTPIDIVTGYGGAVTPLEAANWLCERIGVEPAALGWQSRSEGSQGFVGGDNTSEGAAALAGMAVPAAKPAEPPRPVIRATPFVWQDPATMPRRQWLYGFHYIRKFISALVAPTGVGKSSLAIVEALAIASGRALLGIKPRERARVWLWNGEDPAEEIKRRVLAAMMHFDIKPADVEGWLFIDSGRDMPIVLAEMERTGVKIARPVSDGVIDTMRENEIDLLMVDPFVSAHHVTENDNMAIDAVAKEFNRIAEATNAAIGLVHHSRKTNGAEVTTEDSRGAVALMSAARVGRALNVMSQEESERADVENRFDYFRADTGKSNMAPRDANATWFKVVSVRLGNGRPRDNACTDFNEPEDEGDKVGVVTSWEWPALFDTVQLVDLEAVQRKVAAFKYRENAQATDWVGNAVAEVLDLDITKKGHRSKIGALLRTWFSNKALEVYDDQDERREVRKFVRVGPGS